MQMKILGILFALLSMPLAAAADSEASAHSTTVMNGGGAINVSVDTEVNGVHQVQSFSGVAPAGGVHIEAATSTTGVEGESGAYTSVRVGPPAGALSRVPAVRPLVRPATGTRELGNASSAPEATTSRVRFAPFPFVADILNRVFGWLTWF